MASRTTFTGAYERRVIDDDLDELFAHLPAILLDGPKGVGKTATAQHRAQSVRRLDDDIERAIVAADPSIVGTDAPPVLIDEWHRHPPVFDAVRRLVDDDLSAGRFLLTGSAPTRQTHSGAGRITTLRMRPLSLRERRPEAKPVSLGALLDGSATVEGRCSLGLVDYVEEITAGGFPGMRHLSGRALDEQLDSYIGRIVDHDLDEAGYSVRRPATVLAWLRAYAAATGTTTSWDKIRDAATSGIDDKPAKTTTLTYIELLTALRILDPLEAWLPTHNHLRSLNAAPKHHLADPALAARLVRRSAAQLLQGQDVGTAIARDGTFLGALFESLAALSLRTYARRSDAEVRHLRTQGGRHEIDFIIDRGDGVVAIEAKLAGAVGDEDVKHLLWLRREIGEESIDTVVLHTGPQAYRRPDGVAVIPLGLLGP